ncbi:MAG: phospholipid/cholesterol/gamma-HCH transport system substrate-binding protein [Thermoleophilaceae bacterium]|jgi:ABC-type transporter Mla subunit MlaD|nr:phospholipid/cholesterol/gamma-HCH transport system substrate-binding protein [Thermoleophilaceae bacterium]
MRRQNLSTFGILESPLLVGTITTLVIFVAMFISYNANNGLPFVPTYSLTATAPSSDGLLPGGQVLIGGRRVGFVQNIQAGQDDNGRPVAYLNMQLDLNLQGAVKQDAQVRVRPLSVFEYKYLDLLPGTADKALPEGTVMPLSSTLPNVGLTDTFSTFDSKTRENLDHVLVGLGDGLAGRGAGLNEAFGQAASLLRNIQPVLSDLAKPSTGLALFASSLARFTHELAPVAGSLSGIFSNGEITLAALEAAGPEFEQGLDKLPGSLATASDALTVLTPVLGKARALTEQIEPAARLLPSTTRRVTDALKATTPVLDRVPSFGNDLDGALQQLGGLSSDHPLEPSLRLLTGGLGDLEPTVHFIAPYQEVCNYVALALRNVASTVSEGNAGGTWLRFQVFLPIDEMTSAAKPVSGLHYNPYPNGAAPGQPHECESGNQEFKPGQQIGNIPGRQPAKTEITHPGDFHP